MFRLDTNARQGKELQQTRLVKTERATADNLTPGLEALPYDSIQLIANQHLSTQDVCHWAQTCRFLCHATQLTLNQRKLKTLSHHVVVEPNEVKVTAMLNAKPRWVDVKIKEVVDHAGRIHTHKTIFQLAFGARDDAMCLVMKPSFVKVYGSEEASMQAMERQCNEMLAEESTGEHEEKEKESKAHLEKLLSAVIAAINVERFNGGKDTDNKLILSSATLAAIQTFREAFAKMQAQEDRKGMHFRHNTLLETYKAYAEAATRWSYNKCALFEDGVLSFILSYVPENDAQKFSQGLYYLQEGERDKRSFKLRVGGRNFYDVTRGPSSVFVLSGSYVDIFSGSRASREFSPRSASEIFLTFVDDLYDDDERVRVRRRRPPESFRLSELLLNKNIKFAKLMGPTESQPQPQCVIC